MAAYILGVYLWLTLAVALGITLIDCDTKEKETIVVILMIIFPLALLSFYSDNIKNMIVRILTMTTTLNKNLSTLKDKAAIRFINVLDMLRGDYDNGVSVTEEPVHNEPSRMTRQSYRRGK